MKLLIKLFLILALILGAVSYYMPYHALKEMQRGARAGYDKKTMRHVNLPVLQENFIRLLKKEAKDSGRYILFFRADITDYYIEEIIKRTNFPTPQVLADLLIYGDSDLSALEERQYKTTAKMEAFVSAKYEGLNVFAVSIKKKKMGAKPFYFIFTRKGLLSWELTDISYTPSLSKIYRVN